MPKNKVVMLLKPVNITLQLAQIILMQSDRLHDLVQNNR